MRFNKFVDFILLYCSCPLAYADPVRQVHFLQLSKNDCDVNKRTCRHVIHDLHPLHRFLPRAKLVLETDFFLAEPAQARDAAFKVSCFRLQAKKWKRKQVSLCVCTKKKNYWQSGIYVHLKSIHVGKCGNTFCTLFSAKCIATITVILSFSN